MQAVRTLVDRPKTWMKKTYVGTLLRKPRRFHIFGVGANKTGTLSLARVFSRHYRAAHEPHAAEVVSVILARAAGRISDRAFERFIIGHDRLTWLEMHSSQLNYDFLEILVRRFEDARFVLTIRDCYSWVDSCFNQKLNYLRYDQPFWDKMRDWKFVSDRFKHGAEEELLAKRGLPTLDGYLSYWTRHNSTVLSTVPSDRLLVVRTDRLSDSISELAAFAGVPAATLDMERIHSHKAPKSHGLLYQLDADYVRAKVEAHCAQLMERFFPDVTWPA